MKKQTAASSVFSELKLKPENNECFECHNKNSEWCSVNNGIFLCLQCAGVHRSLGVHISFIRSISMDIWSQKQLEIMSVGGNRELQEFFDYYLISSLEIRKKYKTKASSYYREYLKLASEGKTPTQERPSIEEGCIIPDEERKIPDNTVEFHKDPNITNIVGNVVKKTQNIGKNIGKNIKDKVNEINIKKVEDKAIQAYHNFGNTVDSWNVKQKIQHVKSGTENYYKNLAETAKNMLARYHKEKDLEDNKLIEGEDELLLDPQGKFKKNNIKKK
jgi:Putative GTPase activating protein for Arf